MARVIKILNIEDRPSEEPVEKNVTYEVTWDNGRSYTVAGQATIESVVGLTDEEIVQKVWDDTVKALVATKARSLANKNPLIGQEWEPK